MNVSDSPWYPWLERRYGSEVAGRIIRETIRATVALQPEVQKADYALHRLVAEKFSSGNAIPVERISITRAEWNAAIAQQRTNGDHHE